mgnify:CR=1 FL=1
MKRSFHFTCRRLPARAAILALCSASQLSGAVQVLLNGTISTGEWGFTTFLDETEVGSRAWSFRNDLNPMAPINTGGALSNVTPVAVTTTGGSDLIISGANFAALSGFDWGSGFSDQAARNAMSNGSGFFGEFSITIAPSAVVSGTTYRVELLAFARFAEDRRFNVSANGVDQVTDWTILNAPPYNQVLEFDVLADEAGIVLNLGPGSVETGVDTLAYVHALAITPIPEPNQLAVLGVFALGLLFRRAR